jgi:predicted Ser/Thr protein kinase/membrane protein implicated in regulation of membrane protease activity
MLSMGQQFGRYRIESKLGEGGMGVVYRAVDPEFDRTVAIKVLRPDLAGTDRRTRFALEAKAIAAVHHPHIVAVHEVGSEQGLDFICMEFVDGETLEQRMARRRLGIDEALVYAIALADALSAAHAVGLVHRDVKPGNILLTSRGEVKLMDFGLAKFKEPANVTEFTATRTMFTQSGQILGTVSYMSPEQAEGRLVDGRSDIFSFGSVLYEMITSQRPFDGDSNLSTLAAILSASPKRVTELQPAASSELEQAIDRCLEKTPGRRFSCMLEVKRALESQLNVEAGRLIHPRVRRWMTSAKSIGVALAGLGAMWGAASHIKPSDVYLCCFLAGVFFSAVAALSGGFHLHFHHGGMHLPSGHGAASSGISGFNVGTVTAFVAWFGGTGYLLAAYFGLGLVPAYAGAVVGGVAGAAVVYMFLAKLLAKSQDLNPADYDLIGVIGRLSSPIREGGIGEITYSQAGIRRAASARSTDGVAIPLSAKVVVVRKDGGIVYVRPVE